MYNDISLEIMYITIEQILYIIATLAIIIVASLMTWCLYYIVSILKKFEHGLQDVYEKSHKLISILEYLPKHTGLLLAGLTELLSFFKERRGANHPKNFHPDFIDKEE